MVLIFTNIWSKVSISSNYSSLSLSLFFVFFFPLEVMWSCCISGLHIVYRNSQTQRAGWGDVTLLLFTLELVGGLLTVEVILDYYTSNLSPFFSYASFIVIWPLSIVWLNTMSQSSVFSYYIAALILFIVKFSLMLIL